MKSINQVLEQRLHRTVRAKVRSLHTTRNRLEHYRV